MSRSARVPHALHVCGGHTPYTRDEHAHIRGIPILIVLVSPPSGRCGKKGGAGGRANDRPPALFLHVPHGLASALAHPARKHEPVRIGLPAEAAAAQFATATHPLGHARAHPVTHPRTRRRHEHGRLGDTVTAAVAAVVTRRHRRIHIPNPDHDVYPCDCFRRRSPRCLR